MSQREGETDYKYEDYAADMAYHRIPTTSDLVGQKMKVTLDDGKAFDLEFTGKNEVKWQSGSDGGTDWCEVIEVAPKTYYIDMTFVNAPRECRTFFINTQTRQTLSVHTNMREGEIGHEPRAVQDFVPGVLGDPDGAMDDSHATGLLEYPHYTRPPEFRGWEVPDILLSGDHGKIELWRRQQSLLRTLAKRPDLLEKAELTEKERKFLEEYKNQHSKGGTT